MSIFAQWRGGTLLLWLITSKRFEIESWDWSHFEDILEDNLLNFQDEGWGPLGDPTGAQEDQKWPKLTKILDF